VFPFVGPLRFVGRFFPCEIRKTRIVRRRERFSSLRPGFHRHAPRRGSPCPISHRFVSFFRVPPARVRDYQSQRLRRFQIEDMSKTAVSGRLDRGGRRGIGAFPDFRSGHSGGRGGKEFRGKSGASGPIHSRRAPRLRRREMVGNLCLQRGGRPTRDLRSFEEPSSRRMHFFRANRSFLVTLDSFPVGLRKLAGRTDPFPPKGLPPRIVPRGRSKAPAARVKSYALRKGGGWKDRVRRSNPSGRKTGTAQAYRQWASIHCRNDRRSHAAGPSLMILDFPGSSSCRPDRDSQGAVGHSLDVYNLQHDR